ncbi:hypothetical protein HK105_203921 [Polyrhizophydium stewartii]|uniref:Small nuclear ribonucleoprotein G n=1 Tax=Polyrhizophydium stewartii TaxID=2732419 RepID=A0ABR4NAF3_9FUNG
MALRITRGHFTAEIIGRDQGELPGMPKPVPPELKKYMDKRLLMQLNGNRKVTGILRGFDPFMNVVLEEAYEEISESERTPMGSIVIRGNSISVIEALERIAP